MFDVKKFTAFIAFNDEFRNLYYDIAESRGVTSCWDVYHIQEGRETPQPSEIEIMSDIFKSKVLPNEKVLAVYNSADKDFRKKVEEKVRNQNFNR